MIKEIVAMGGRRRRPGYVKTRPGYADGKTAYTDMYEITPGRYVSAGTFGTYERAEHAWMDAAGLIRPRRPARPGQRTHEVRRVRGDLLGHCGAHQGQHQARLPRHHRPTTERSINRLKQNRAVATRYDKRDYVFRGTVDVAAIGIWLATPIT
jgi:hypothetical protein